MKNKTIDIILPCFNPVLGWHKQLLTSLQKLERLTPEYSWQLILVNDGSKALVSPKEIAFLKQNLQAFKYIGLEKNLGKGAALKIGFAESKSTYSFFTDIDFPYQEENIVSMLQKLEQKADIVVGIRNQAYYKKVPLVRSILSSGFKKLIKIIFRIPTTDTQAGLKAFSTKGREMILQTETNRYLFDLELIKRSAKANLNFAYVNLNLKDNVVLSKLSFKILFSELKNLFRIIAV